MTNYLEMHGWTITARKFRAPMGEGFHYYGSFADADYVGPCNTAEDVSTEIGEIRAEIRPVYADWQGSGSGFGSPDAQRAETERASVIALARRLDAVSLDSEGSYSGPGRFEGNSDRLLAVALDIIAGNGAADESAGDVEYGLHGSRTGRFILWTDSQGFLTADEYPDDIAAAQALEEEDRAQNPGDEDA